MTESEVVRESRKRYEDRLKAKYPDREFADDEALFRQINDDYDDYDKEISDMREREKKFVGMFSNSPASASFFMDWYDGKHPLIEFIRRFGKDSYEELLSNPEKLAELEKADKERADEIAKDAEFKEEREKNLLDTFAVIERLVGDGTYSDNEIDDAIGFLINIMRDALMGKFTEDSIHMAMKALKHDGDVAEAEHEGEVRGRNIKIEEKLRKGNRNDGTADLAGKGSGGGQGRRIPDMSSYGPSSIWDRGGGRRIKNR